MSLSAEPVKTYIVDDPRIDFDREAHYLVERSGGDVTYRTWKCSSASTSSISFNTLIPSRDTAVSSKIYVKIPISVDVECPNGAAAGAGLISQDIALRFLPFLSCCNSIQLELNGKAQSTNIYRYIAALMRFCNSRDEMTNDFSTSATYLDQFSSYYDSDLAGPTPGVGAPWASNRNPMGSYQDGVDYLPTQRAGYLQNIWTVPVTVPPAPANNTATFLRFNFDIEEIIPLSPLFWGHREVKSLFGLDTLNITFQIRDLARMFCSRQYNSIAGAPANQSPNLRFTFNEAALNGALLEFIYIKPRANVPVPRTLHYPYNNIKDFSILGDLAIARNATQEATFSNIQLQGVPKRLYIFAKRQEADERYYTTDTFARIEGISLDLGTRSGLLAECTPEALYRMSVKNGYRGTWDAWYKHTGSVLCIDFGSDVSLDLLDAPGALKQMQISFRLRIKNLYSNRENASDGATEANVRFQYYCIVVYDGMMIIKDGDVLFESNDVSALDVADSSKVRKLSYDDVADYVYGGMYTGGSLSKFISKAKTGLSKAKDFAQQKIIPGVQKALPYVEKGVKVAAEVLPALAALGYTEEEIFDIVSGKGGKMMPKKSIKARAARK